MNDNSAQFHLEADDVFARIAKDYDRYCDYFSLYIHRLWKRALAAQVTLEKAGDWLDLASGTGDIPARVLRRPGHPANVVVSDICQPMLDVARRKLPQTTGLTYSLLDACDMATIPDNSFNLITMAFAMKIVDRSRALAEIRRCLKPGGVFLCLEASRIGWSPLHRLYLAYMNACLPIMGRLMTHGDPATYNYLLRGIHDFPGAPALADELRTHGFDAVTYRPLSLGIVAIQRAVKPE